MNTPKLSTDLFTWDKSENAFVSEASTLEANTTTTQGKTWVKPLLEYNQKLGFALISHKTGSERICLFSREMRNIENELYGWEFAPVSHDEFKVIIFND